MHKLYFAIAFLVVSPVGNAADLGKQFVTAKLSYGASVSVPKSWQVLHGNEMRAIETSVGAAIDLAGYAQQFEGAKYSLWQTFLTLNFTRV